LLGVNHHGISRCREVNRKCTFEQANAALLPTQVKCRRRSDPLVHHEPIGSLNSGQLTMLVTSYWEHVSPIHSPAKLVWSRMHDQTTQLEQHGRLPCLMLFLGEVMSVLRYPPPSQACRRKGKGDQQGHAYKRALFFVILETFHFARGSSRALDWIFSASRAAGYITRFYFWDCLCDLAILPTKLPVCCNRRH
jgi:hypothetical protein